MTILGPQKWMLKWCQKQRRISNIWHHLDFNSRALVPCANYYLVFEPSARWFWRGRVWEGEKCIYKNNLPSIDKRFHKSCYILFFATISVRRIGFLLVIYNLKVTAAHFQVSPLEAPLNIFSMYFEYALYVFGYVKLFLFHFCGKISLLISPYP
jgi:hypothetical protein